MSPLLLVARALLVAVARHPMINASWDEAAQEIVVKHYVNLGIAAATDRGLMVPNVKDAHALTLPELAGALGQLAETARAGKATPADLSRRHDHDHQRRRLRGRHRHPDPARRRGGDPGVRSGQGRALGGRRPAGGAEGVTLALSFDHRLVDGDLGSAVLRDVGAMLTDPLRMLAWS